NTGENRSLRPSDLYHVLRLMALWICGRRVSVVQAQRQIHGAPLGRPGRRRRLAVAPPPALLRDQTRGGGTSKRLQQPPHLALATPQQLRCRTHRQPTIIDVPQALETPYPPVAHAQHRHRCRPPQPAKKPGRLTFSNWTALTFARYA